MCVVSVLCVLCCVCCVCLCAAFDPSLFFEKPLSVPLRTDNLLPIHGVTTGVIYCRGLHFFFFCFCFFLGGGAGELCDHRIHRT